MVKPHSSISLKITVYVLCGTSIVFALALAYSYSYSRRIILEEAESSARNLALSVARRIETGIPGRGQSPQRFDRCSGNEQPRQRDPAAPHSPAWSKRAGKCMGLPWPLSRTRFDKGLRWFAPYYSRAKPGSHTNSSDQILRLFHQRLVPRSKSAQGPGLDRPLLR